MAGLKTTIHGVFITRDPETDRIEEVPTTQCCHCGAHFEHPRFGTSEADKRSRKGRGYCHKCNGYVCGRGCEQCIPEEARLENLEAGRPELTMPRIIVPGG